MKIVGLTFEKDSKTTESKSGNNKKDSKTTESKPGEENEIQE